MYSFNKFFILFFLLTAFNCFSQNKPDTKKSPNIKFIFSDDHATNAISAYAGISKKEVLKWLIIGVKIGETVVYSENLSNEETRKWKYQKYIKDYLATIKSVDDNIGRVLEYLKENGLEENTIVVYASDQGFFLGEYGFFDKRFMYEEALRMPFIIRYSGKIKSGIIVDDIITNIDFAPTLLEMAVIPVPEEVQGNSFFSNLIGKTLKIGDNLCIIITINIHTIIVFNLITESETNAIS